MNFLVEITFLSCILAAYANPFDRIIGGTDAPVGAYPYQVSLRKRSSHFCGGSIVNKRCVLTAAHCLEGQVAGNIKVHAGTNFLNEQGQVREASKIYYHNGFDAFRLENDVGIIILEEDLEFGKTVQPITLHKNNITDEGVPATLSGWGRTVVGGVLPNALQQIQLKVIGRQLCRDKQWRITESHICTLTKTGEGACHGDSGSPLTSDNEQIGIVSFGTPCARGEPDVYTRISTFYDWIETRCTAALSNN